MFMCPFSSRYASGTVIFRQAGLSVKISCGEIEGGFITTPSYMPPTMMQIRPNTRNHGACRGHSVFPQPAKGDMMNNAESHEVLNNTSAHRFELHSGES